MTESLDRPPPSRGVPLVRTWARWSLSALGLGVSFAAVVEAYVRIARPGWTLASVAGPLAIACVLEALLLFALLHAEEARLVRELRTARTGTPTLRGLVTRRRQQAPFFARLFSTRLGNAAVLLADGDRDGALDLLRSASPLMTGGRLDALRRIVDADVDRAAGTSVGRERCIADLRAREPLGHREADLYRTHVLVKAILEQGDAESGLELAEALARSEDDDDRVYLTWLRAWFGLDAEAEHGYREPPASDPWPRLDEGDLRRAVLVARAHGAEKLVEELDARLSIIARKEPRE